MSGTFVIADIGKPALLPFIYGILRIALKLINPTLTPRATLLAHNSYVFQ